VNEIQHYGTLLYSSLIKDRQVRKAAFELNSKSVLFTRSNKEKYIIDSVVFKKVAKGFIKGSVNELTKPLTPKPDDPIAKEVVKIIAKTVRDIPYEDLYLSKHL
jgi:hypothetical protein